jgi:glycosyltransferase involved in cell wall biosynthesis
MSAISVAHVIDHLGAGGAQRLVVDIATRQARRDMSVAVIALRGPTPLSAELAAAGVPVHCLDRGKWDLRQVTTLQRLLHALRPTVAHLHLMGAHTIGRLAAALAGVPATVLHDHEAGAETYVYPGPLLALRRLVEPRIAAPGVAYIALTEEAAAYAVNVSRRPAQQVAVVPNGIDLAHLAACALDRAAARSHLGLPAWATLIVSVGRLQPVKGFDLLLEAIATMPATVHLALAGDGPERAALAACAARPGLAGRVHLLGHLADVRPLLRAGDIYAQPSRREPFGLAAAEAAACGLPVVASAVGGLREIVCHGETGLLVPPGDPAELAAALAQLVADPPLLRRLGSAARERAHARLSIERTVERLDALYRSLIFNSQNQHALL